MLGNDGYTRVLDLIADEAMSAINESSKKVADTIGVIDEMIFQGNLLALNAAVEAARAGEQGRAFAVIASEVRNLAQRAAGAVKEIRQLINDSGDRVKQGTAMLDESGRTLEDIAKGTGKVGDIITEMAVDSIEQTRGVEQVNNAVTRVDEVTQQSLALVEQVATASEILDKQSRSLQKMMALLEAGQDIASAPRRDNRLMGRSATQPIDARQGMRPQDDDEWNKL